MEPTHPTYEPTAAPSTVAPSTEPSLNPTFAPVSSDAPVVTVQATQTVAGVTSDSADFRTAFASAVMSLLPTGSTVTIISVTVVNVRRRQLLTTAAVSVVYTVQSTAPVSTLTTSLSSGTAAMTTVLQQSYPAAKIAAPKVVTIANPTAAPTAESTTSINNVSSSGSSSASPWVSVGAGIGGGVLLLLFVAGYLWHRRRLAKRNQTIAIQAPSSAPADDNGDALEVANLRQTVKPLAAATIPMEPELPSGSEEDQVVSSTVQRKPNNQPSPSSLRNNVAMVHIEGHHVIDIPLERDGAMLMPQDSTMWDDEPREVDIETPVESRRGTLLGSRVPSLARSRNVSPALRAEIPPILYPSLSPRLSSHPQRMLLPPLASPMKRTILPPIASPPNTGLLPGPLTFTASKHSPPTGAPPPAVNPQLMEWIAQAREWKEVCADDTGASSYYNETTQESIWEAPTSQGYTRADTRLVLRDGTVIDDPATAPALEASLTTSMVPSDPLALTSVKSDITWC